MKFKARLVEETTPLPGSIPRTIHYKLPVKLKYEGLTILDLYLKSFPKISKEIWLNKIKNGLLTVNGKTCKSNLVLKAGWITENTVHNKTEPIVSNDIKLIFENEQIIVINKPSPLPMHPCGRFNRNSLSQFLKISFQKQSFKITHRLDANTTGVIILAKNTFIANEISEQFRKCTVKKEYLAVVEGIVFKESFIINKKISKDRMVSGARKLSTTGSNSETKITVLNRNYLKNITLLKVEPKNGRTNQIRLHLASIKHPIIGDLGYKNPLYFEKNPLTYPSDTLYLHSHKINILLNNIDTQFIAEIPKKFFKFMQ